MNNQQGGVRCVLLLLLAIGFSCTPEPSGNIEKVIDNRPNNIQIEFYIKERLDFNKVIIIDYSNQQYTPMEMYLSTNYKYCEIIDYHSIKHNDNKYMVNITNNSINIYNHLAIIIVEINNIGTYKLVFESAFTI